MIFSEKIIVGKSITNLSLIINNINSREKVDVYIICLDKNNDNILMEVIHTSHIYKPIYRKKDWVVIGVAKNRNEVLELVQAIIVKNIDNIYSGVKFKNNYERIN